MKNGFSLKKNISLRKLVSDLRPVDILIAEIAVEVTGVVGNQQTLGESASFPQYLGCNTVFDMRLRVTFLRRKTVSLQSNIAHRE